MQIWIPLVSSIVAALLGGLITDRLRRPRLRLIPTSLRLSADVIPHGSVVEPNADLVALCSESPYVEFPPFVAAGKVDEREYVSYLQSTLTGAQEYVRVHFPATAERAQQLQTKLAADDFEGVARIWSREPQLWPATEGPYIRREFDLPPPQGGQEAAGHSTGSGAHRYERVDQPDGTVVLMQQGPPYTVLGFEPRDRLGPPGERSRELAHRLGKAFEQGLKPDLIQVFNFLARIEREIPALENLSRKIETELSRLKRLTITALISNAGGTPVSISNPRCLMTLHVSGYPYQIGEQEDARQVVERDDRSLELALVNDHGRTLPPMVVESGGVKVITGVYSEPLAAEPLTEGGTLFDLVRSSVESSERTWTMSLQAVLPRDPSKTISSRKVSFSSLKEQDRAQPLGTSVAESNPLERKVAAQDAELSGARAELSGARAELSTLRQTLLALEGELRACLGARAQSEVETPPAQAALEEGDTGH